MTTPRTHSGAGLRPQGLNCPDCAGWIVVDAITLLAQSPKLTCARCGLELQLDVAASAETLHVLRRYLASIDQAAQSADAATSGDASTRGRTSRQARHAPDVRSPRRPRRGER